MDTRSKRTLFTSTSIEVRSSDLHGYGVFALKEIPEGETIEECAYFTLDTKIEDEKLLRYAFKRPYEPNSLEWMKARLLNQAFCSVVLGYGSIYNHNKEPNISYAQNPEDRIFKFYTIKPVHKDEELCHDYNSDWSRQLDSK